MSEIFQYVFPGMMMMWMFFNAQNLMSDILTERDKKTLFRLSASTLSISQFVISKIIRVFIVCLISEFLLIGFTWLVFDVNWGNPLWLVVILSACNVAFTGIVAVIYAFSSTVHAANAVATIIILISSMTGGSMIPFDELPKFIQYIGNFTVNRHAILGIHVLMFDMDIGIMLYAALKLTGIGILLVMIAIYRFYYRIAAGEML